MTTLYAIAAEYQAAAAQLADMDLDAQTIADTLEGMAGALEVKAQSVAMVIRSMEADAAAIRQWAKDANQRATSIEGRAGELREYLSNTMQVSGILKISGPGVSMSFRRSAAVVIDSPDLVPDEFCVVPTPPLPAPSKTLVGAALKAGRDVPGAHMEQRMNLQIN